MKLIRVGSLIAFSLCTSLLAMSGPVAGADTPAIKQLPAKDIYTRPFPAFRIAGNLYYVGSYDLAVYLITTPEGHILINTGVNDSATQIRASVESLGFRFGDIKLLLATHGHWDHVGAMADIKRMTGAPLMVHEADADLVESGGNVDYRFPSGRGTVYEPVKVERWLKEGDVVGVGQTQLTVIHHPGHTKGSTSFTFKATDGTKTHDVLIVNMGSINPGVNVLFMQAFGGINKAYLDTLAKQKKLKPQIWVSSHAAQFNMHQKYQPGDAYDPERFVDPDGYAAKIAFYEKLFGAAMERDKARQ
jgi:metallo-beta-lactamase class B